jgi:hypothetical protein
MTSRNRSNGIPYRNLRGLIKNHDIERLMGRIQILCDREGAHKNAWFQPWEQLGDSSNQLPNWNMASPFSDFLFKQTNFLPWDVIE